jgi:signal transduction histidine kinase/ActR/RegA family two-component response regulator
METPSPTGTAHILVVDDEPGIRDMLHHELRLQGYTCETATNGLDALEKITKRKFQIAICDINMPGMNGLDVLEAMRQRDPDMEVIMVTGYATIEMAVRAMRAGAYDFVQKPFNLQEILLLIEKSLERSELRALTAVYEASRAMFRSVKLEVLLPLISDLSLRILKADDVAIMLFKKGVLTVAATAGLTQLQDKEARRQLGQNVASQPQSTLEPILIAGPVTEDIKSAIVYPLVIEDQFLGVLNVNRTREDRAFTNADLRSATIFGPLITQAVYNAQLYKQLEDKISELESSNKKLEDTQAQLIQSEKLAGIGQLAAGVAHELNNPLSGVLGFTQLLLEDTSLTPQQRRDLDTIHTQSQRCRTIIQNLLQFSRRKDPKKESIDLLELLKATLELVRYDLSTSGLVITEKLPESLPLIFGDGQQLQQVFLNLITNAKHAMEGKEKKEVGIEAKVEQGKVVVKIRDNGSGIPVEARTKVFDPFFTTKPPGQGTGLGLSICYGIIQEHKAVLRFETEMNVGTTFIVEIPIAS